MKTLKEWEELTHKKVGKTYYHNIKLFVNTANINTEKARYSDIINYLSILRKTKLSARNIKNHLSAIKFYYNCLLDLEIIEQHPCKSLQLEDKIDKSINIETLFTATELETFLNRKQPCNSKLKLRNKIINQLLVYQALTVNELVNLKLHNIDLENVNIHIENSRTLNLHPKQILPLQHYINIDRTALKTTCSSDLLLLSKSGKAIPKRCINDLINYKAIKKYSPQKIRQSVICNLLKTGQDLRKVQLFAGHKYISSTEKYIATKFIELKSELEKKHPLL